MRKKLSERYDYLKAFALAPSGFKDAPGALRYRLRKVSLDEADFDWFKQKTGDGYQNHPLWGFLKDEQKRRDLRRNDTLNATGKTPEEWAVETKARKEAARELKRTYARQEYEYSNPKGHSFGL